MTLNKNEDSVSRELTELVTHFEFRKHSLNCKIDHQPTKLSNDQFLQVTCELVLIQYY